MLVRTRWMRNRHFDIVHAFESRPVGALGALNAQRHCRAKLVMQIGRTGLGRGGSVEERTNPVVRALLRPIETFFEERFRCRAQGTTVINTVLRDKALALGVSSDTMLLLRNGSDVTRMHPLSVSAARKQLDLLQDIHLVGYVGAIFSRDAELMAQAFDLIHAADPTAPAPVTGYFNAPIERLLSDPRSVCRTGRIAYADIETYLSACDVCWLPLKNSGGNRGRWPLKLNDYMAVGRPIVATDVGDMASFFAEYPIGHVVADDAESLAQAVLNLLADRQMRYEFGERGRQLAETEFSWECPCRAIGFLLCADSG